MLDRSVLRWAGLAGVVGAVLGTIANLLHPRGEFGSAQAVVDMAADSGIWVFDHYLIAWSAALGGLALLAFGRSFVAEPARSWGWIAGLFTIGSLVVVYLLTAIDGTGLKDAAEHGGDAAIAVAHVSGALFTAMMGSMFGIVPILFGIALMTTTQYPRWLATLALVSGAVGVFTGSYQYLVGYNEVISNYLFTLGSLGTTAFVFAASWYLWKGEYAGIANEPIAARL